MNAPQLQDLTRRMARMEAKLTQVMLHLGLHPQEHRYETPPNVPPRQCQHGKNRQDCDICTDFL